MNHLLIGAVGLLCSTGSAQVFTDTFSIPTLPSIPVFGWTPEVGNWQVTTGGRLKTDGASTWAYITKDGFTARNCVLDCEAFYTPSGVQFAGLTARYASSGSTIMCKIQENTTASQDFDRAFIYEQGGTGGSAYADTTTLVTTSAFCRLIVAEAECWMQMDFDKDGVYDQTIGPKPLTTSLAAGKLGLNLYGISELDNFEYFDAVLMPQANPPKIGTTFKMDLHVEATQITPWRMALSLGNKGFPFGPYRIPLDVDAVFNLSLALGGPLGLAGITDAQGKATPGLVIPNDPVLIGFGVFAAALAIDGTKPMAVGGVSNEIYIKFEQ